MSNWGPDDVHAVVDELPFEAVEALWLVDMCGLKYRDAARVACCSRSTFARQLHQARREIRQRLDQPLQTD